MTDLKRHPGLAVFVHEIDDAPVGIGMLGAIHAGAARRDPALGRHAAHFGEHQARAALCARPQVHQVKVAHSSVHRAVHVHRRHHHAVGQLQALDPIRDEHRRHRAGAAGFAPAVPALHPLEPAAVAQPQVLVADPLAAGQERIVELLRREARIAGHVLEPFGRIARRRLQLDHLQPPALLVFLQRLVGATAAVQRFGQFDGVLQPQLRAGPDREVRGMRRVACQDQVAVAPLPAVDPPEVQPGVPLDMAGVAHQTVSAQMPREYLLKRPAAFLLAHFAESEPLPGVGAALGDKGRKAVLEAVGVRPDPALLKFPEDEIEGLEVLLRPQPLEVVGPGLDFHVEVRRVGLAKAAVDAVGGDD